MLIECHGTYLWKVFTLPNKQTNPHTRPNIIGQMPQAQRLRLLTSRWQQIAGFFFLQLSLRLSDFITVQYIRCQNDMVNQTFVHLLETWHYFLQHTWEMLFRLLVQRDAATVRISCSTHCFITITYQRTRNYKIPHVSGWWPRLIVSISGIRGRRNNPQRLCPIDLHWI